MAYSSIQRKRCKCSLGCTYYPSIGWAGYYQPHAPQELKDKQTVKQVAKRKKANLNTLSRNLKGVQEQVDSRTKSQLMAEADRVFSLFIRIRDSDKNGNIECVCCGKVFNVEDKDSNGDKVVQCLHYIKREVYSLRFDENNAAAGCSNCNRNMHYNIGESGKQYRERMVADFGEQAVREMEIECRKINRIEAQQLKNIIEHYSKDVCSSNFNQ